MKPKYQFNLTIQGTKQGEIWWPAGAVCEKSFSYRVKDGSHFTDGKRESLRDAVLRITNDGDFQGCNLLLDSCVRVEMVKWTGTSTISRTRYFEINSVLFPSIQDCIVEDYPVFEES